MRKTLALHVPWHDSPGMSVWSWRVEAESLACPPPANLSAAPSQFFHATVPGSWRSGSCDWDEQVWITLTLALLSADSRSSSSLSCWWGSDSTIEENIRLWNNFFWIIDYLVMKVQVWDYVDPELWWKIFNVKTVEFTVTTARMFRRMFFH